MDEKKKNKDALFKVLNQLIDKDMKTKTETYLEKEVNTKDDIITKNERNEHNLADDEELSKSVVIEKTEPNTIETYDEENAKRLRASLGYADVVEFNKTKYEKLLNKDNERKRKWNAYMKKYNARKKKEYQENINKIVICFNNTSNSYDKEDVKNVLHSIITTYTKIINDNINRLSEDIVEELQHQLYKQVNH